MRANYFNLLLVLLMGVLPIQLQASESDKNVILYTPYTKIAVPPGESVNYSIDVINNYDVVKNVNLSVKGLPRGWNYELKAGTWTISELAVLPHDKKNVSLKVDIPLKVNKGTYRFTVVAEGLGELPIAITVSKQGTYQTAVSYTHLLKHSNCHALVSVFSIQDELACGLLKIIDIDNLEISRTLYAIHKQGTIDPYAELLLRFCESRNRKSKHKI